MAYWETYQLKNGITRALALDQEEVVMSERIRERMAELAAEITELAGRIKDGRRKLSCSTHFIMRFAATRDTKRST